MRPLCVLLLLAGLLTVCPAVMAQQTPVKVTTTGDSITVDYGTNILQQSFNTKSPGGFGVSSVSSGGNYWERYVGIDADPTAGNAYRDYAQEVINQNPDYIVFMLGVNDISYINILNRPRDQAVANFKTAIDGVFDRYEAYANQKGGKTHVLVLSILPVLPVNGDLAWINNSGLIEEFNTWYAQDVQQRTRFSYLDVNGSIRQLADWQSLYSDGVHLRANNYQGSMWLADQVATDVIRLQTVPEPAGMVLMGLGALGLRFKRKTFRAAP